MWSNSRPLLPIQSFSRLCTLFSNRNHLPKGHWVQHPGSKNNEFIYLCTIAVSNDAGKVDQEMFFSQPAFNRAVDRRTDSAWLSEVFLTSALVIPLLGSKNLIKDGVPVMVASTKFQICKKGLLCKPIFLGYTDDVNKPLFAVEVSSFCSSADVPVWMVGAEWVDLRRYGPQLKINDAGLLAYARGMVEWHTRHRFCGCCGDKMEVKEGGHRLHCSSATCASSFYPRLDPAVIVLVTCGDYVLLGRQVVKGKRAMAYHSDIFNDTRENLKHLKLEVKVLGGGRIEHHLGERTIHVYGFSQAYGQANHAVTVTLLQQWFPLHSISLSWDGY